MDFSLSAEQRDLRALVEQVLADRSTPERLAELDAGPDWFDRDLWQGLARCAADGAAALRWMRERAWAGLASMQVGVCERALRMAAQYTSGREQFGRPVAS